MKRREFIKNGCVLCFGGAAMLTILESCSNIPLYKTKSENKIVRVPVNAFLKSKYLIVIPLDVSYNITVIKKTETDFHSLVMKCTHADNPVQFIGNEFKCSLHGSIFDNSGKVKTGPAEKPLYSLVTELINNELIINLK